MSNYQERARNYRDSMLKYVIGLPKIPFLNGEGDIPIGAAVGGTPAQAIETYLRLKSPIHSKEIISYLESQEGGIGRFAVRAPSHDVVTDSKITYDESTMNEERRRISQLIMAVSGKKPGEVESALKTLLPNPIASNPRQLTSRL